MALGSYADRPVSDSSPMDFKDLLTLSIYGNSVERILMAGALFAGIFVALKIFQLIVLLKLKQFAEKTKTAWDDEIIDIVATIKPRFYTLISLFFSLRFLLLPAEANRIVGIAFLILITWEALQVLQRLIGFAIANQLAKTDEEKRKNAPVIRNVNLLVRLALWTMAILLILQNLGINVTSLIAGLGIGGLAIALAAQNILGDLFASFSIYFDKPFEVDDFVQIGKDSGTVKAVGLKTTRLQTLQGEELVISNKELTSSRIQNFGKMKRRRVVSILGLEYGTPNEKLHMLAGWLKHVVDEAPHAEFDRAHLKEFSASSLDVEFVYYVTTSDYNVYMDTLQHINLEVKKKFEDEGVEFSFPTQTVHLKQ